MVGGCLVSEAEQTASLVSRREKVEVRRMDDRWTAVPGEEVRGAGPRAWPGIALGPVARTSVMVRECRCGAAGAIALLWTIILVERQEDPAVKLLSA